MNASHKMIRGSYPENCCLVDRLAAGTFSRNESNSVGIPEISRSFCIETMHEVFLSMHVRIQMTQQAEAPYNERRTRQVRSASSSQAPSGRGCGWCTGPEPHISERHRHQYEVNPSMVDRAARERRAHLRRWGHQERTNVWRSLSCTATLVRRCPVPPF